jgi:hypothetical protein
MALSWDFETRFTWFVESENVSSEAREKPISSLLL